MRIREDGGFDGELDELETVIESPWSAVAKMRTPDALHYRQARELVAVFAVPPEALRFPRAPAGWRLLLRGNGAHSSRHLEARRFVVLPPDDDDSFVGKTPTPYSTHVLSRRCPPSCSRWMAVTSSW